MYGISLILAEGLVQKLRTLHLRASTWEISASDASRVLVALEERVGLSAGAVPLTRNFVREQDHMERYRAVAKMFTLDDSLWEGYHE